MSPTRLCSEPRCPNPARPRSSMCDLHARERERERSARRREATNGVYKRKLWEMRRRQVLFEQPICANCDNELSVDVDHITPLEHGGAPYDRHNLPRTMPGVSPIQNGDREPDTHAGRHTGIWRVEV